MRQNTRDACEEIDAGMFSGDEFYDQQSHAQLQHYVDRWQRELAVIKSDLENPDERCND